MRKAFFTLAVMVMAFGNLGFAQSKVDLKTMSKKLVFKQMGISRDSYIVPQQANYSESDGTQHRTTYYYDESDFYLVEEITETYWDFWQNESRITYNYDYNYNVLEMHGYEWDGYDWEDAMRVSYTYDGDVISEVVDNIKEETGTVIIYEAPHKLNKTLRDLFENLGNRELAIVRELTKIHEEVIRTDLMTAKEKYGNNELKGEIVLIIHGKEFSENHMTLDQAKKIALDLIESGKSKTDAAKEAAKITGIKKANIYKEII